MPLWTTQTRLPVLARMLVDLPLLLPHRPDLLTLPFNLERRHPLHHKLRLMAGRTVLLAGRLDIDSIHPPVSAILDFLTDLYDGGLG